MGQDGKPSMDSNFPEFPDFPIFPPFPTKEERPDAEQNKKRPAAWKAEHVEKDVINLASDSETERRTPATSAARPEPPPTQGPKVCL